MCLSTIGFVTLWLGTCLGGAPEIPHALDGKRFFFNAAALDYSESSQNDKDSKSSDQAVVVTRESSSIRNVNAFSSNHPRDIYDRLFPPNSQEENYLATLQSSVHIVLDHMKTSQIILSALQASPQSREEFYTTETRHWIDQLAFHSEQSHRLTRLLNKTLSALQKAIDI